MEFSNEQPMGELPPDLNEGSQMADEQGDENEPTPILAHASREEIPFFNELQKQEIIDPETNLRDYRLMDYLYDIPEYKQAFDEALSMMQSKKMAEGGHVQPGRPIAPELEELRKQGTGEDTELIIITPKLAELFNEINGGESKFNPITGFPEYGFFKEFLRIAAPIVGAVLGGPIGAFAGSVGANRLTGKSWGDSLKQGAISGGLAFAAPMVGGAFSSAFPGASSALGGATKGVLGSTIGGAVNNLFTPAAAARGAGVLSSLGGNAENQGTSQETAQTASNTGGSILSSLGGNIVPLAAAGLMLAKGHNQEQKAMQDYEAKQKAELDRLRAQSGFNTPWRKPKPYQMEKMEGEISPQDMALGKQRQYFKHAPLDQIDYQLKEGGPIRGIGKGQQDNIPKDIKQNSYIIDASTVSDIGDGSSQAGFKELENFFSRIPSNPVHEKKGGFIKALVSNEEFEVLPDQVTALGGGSNQKGAQILENMVKQIREKKRTSGNKLPPKSKPIDGYLRNLSAA